MQHSGWQSFSVPIADPGGWCGSNTSQFRPELELYAMGDGVPASITFRVANVELVAGNHRGATSIVKC